MFYSFQISDAKIVQIERNTKKKGDFFFYFRDAAYFFIRKKIQQPFDLRKYNFSFISIQLDFPRKTDINTIINGRNVHALETSLIATAVWTQLDTSDKMLLLSPVAFDQIRCRIQAKVVLQDS